MTAIIPGPEGRQELNSEPLTVSVSFFTQDQSFLTVSFLTNRLTTSPGDGKLLDLTD